MASLIPGYEYDVFISYRQKDNKHDGWVTEFVNNLKDELESIFKEEISVYFDINPHDGLLETYDVGASLKDKLKCLIFIPIISRTYCDPKSYAWEHEFKAFVEMASKDQFGLKVKLPNGNVAGRILPVQIHDLKEEDRSQITRELGGILRPVEFIYSEPGVNRPLTLQDSDEKNTNRTNYRNQINKVANAVDEIISSLCREQTLNQANKKLCREEPDSFMQTDENHNVVRKQKGPVSYKLISIAVLIVTLITFAIVILPGLLRKNEYAGTTSVAILPFRNKTGNDKLDNWQNGIQDALISKIAGTSDELKIPPADAINSILQLHSNEYSSLTDKIRKKLQTDLTVTGTLTISGPVMRITAQIIDNRSGNVLQPYIQEGPAGARMFELIDPLAHNIKNYLIIRSLKDDVYIDPERMGYSNDAEAYKYFTYGQKAFSNRNFQQAIRLLKEAEKRDSNLTYATLHIGWAYVNLGIYDSARMWCQKVWRRIKTLPLNQQVYVQFVHSQFFGGYPGQYLEIQKQLMGMDEQWPHLHYDIGNTYFHLNRYKEAATEYEKALDMYRRKGLKPWWANNYTQLAKCYYKTGQYKKAIRTLRMGQRDFPECSVIPYNMAIVSFLRGDDVMGEEYLNKYKDLANLKEDQSIAWHTALMYSDAGMYDKAKKIISHQMKLKSRDSVFIFNYIDLLVTRTDTIIPDLNIVEKIVPNDPAYYECLYIKGCNIFKQKQYAEAFDLLQKSWDLRLKNAIYDHDAFLHLQMARDSLKRSEEMARVK
jgi:tetratricopeptide (TPR) repeat protein